MTVVDASVCVARLVPQDVHHAVSRAWLERYLAGGDIIAGPMLLIAEVAGAISRRTGRPLAHAAVVHLLRLPALRLVAIDRRFGQAATQLVADLGLRGADALYVATAHELQAPLPTLDQDQLSRAASTISASTL